MTKNISLSKDRDLPLLHFLWRWKQATTATLCNKFFPNSAPSTAYKRLWTLSRRKFIQAKADNQYQKFVWTLDRAGFEAVKVGLPELRYEGYRSHSVGHDLLVNAVHLGEWLFNPPKGAGLFSEQQLNALHFEHYPTWVPKTEIHRPDGYWKVPNATGDYTVALEVELTQKRSVRYEVVAGFYARLPEIHRVIWLVPSHSMAKNIHEYLEKGLNGKPSIHNFVSYDQFQNKGWNSPIQIGVDKNKTIANILNYRMENSSKPVSTNFLLDARKTLHRSKASAVFAPGDFSD